MAAVVQSAAQVMPADSTQAIQTAAALYCAAVRALGQEYRGDDETLIRVRDGSGCGEDGCDPACESAGYIAVTLKVTAAATVMLVALRALTPGRGDGTRGMLTLCNLAEVHGVTLELQAAPLDHAGSRAIRMERARRLVAWYKRFGFTGSAYYMVRKPARTPQATGHRGEVMYYIHAQHPRAGEAAIDVAPINRNAAGGSYLPNRLRLVTIPHGRKYTTHAGANRFMFRVLVRLNDFPQLAGYTLTVRSETPPTEPADRPPDASANKATT